MWLSLYLTIHCRQLEALHQHRKERIEPEHGSASVSTSIHRALYKELESLGCRCRHYVVSKEITLKDRSTIPVREGSSLLTMRYYMIIDPRLVTDSSNLDTALYKEGPRFDVQSKIGLQQSSPIHIEIYLPQFSNL